MQTYEGIDSIPFPDPRSADWRYLASIEPGGSALVLGPADQAVPLALSQTCRRVYLVSGELSSLRPFAGLMDHVSSRNVLLLCADPEFFPIAPNSLDLVTSRWQPDGKANQGFRAHAAAVHALLRPGGTAHFTVDNAWSYRGLLSRQNRGHEGTLAGYVRTLKRQNFTNVEAFIPLPSHDAVPLFYLPADSAPAIRHFLANVLPLAESVSPELRARHGKTYRLGKAAVPLILALRATWAAKLFAPGFLLLAQRPATGR